MNHDPKYSKSHTQRRVISTPITNTFNIETLSRVHDVERERNICKHNGCERDNTCLLFHCPPRDGESEDFNTVVVNIFTCESWKSNESMTIGFRGKRHIKNILLNIICKNKISTLTEYIFKNLSNIFTKSA